MSYSNVMYSSEREDWSTPQDLFDKLDREFHFTLDPCASPESAKCKKYYTKEDDGLKQSWKGHVVFCNPPYCRKTKSWVKKCYEEARHADVVALLASRTDTSYFHDYILGRSEIRYLRGRLCFGVGGRAPFASMVVIWRNRGEEDNL